MMLWLLYVGVVVLVYVVVALLLLRLFVVFISVFGRSVIYFMFDLFCV